VTNDLVRFFHACAGYLKALALTKLPLTWADMACNLRVMCCRGGAYLCQASLLMPCRVCRSAVKAAAKEAGAHGCTISGAGPTCVAVVADAQVGFITHSFRTKNALLLAW